MRPAKSAVHTWLQLLRAPNLFTVPGDPLAGALLASGGSMTWRAVAMVFASLCFYGHGLLLNDLADLEEDRRERPRRPLPSGAGSVRTVRFVTIALAVVGLIPCAAMSPASLLAGVILLAAISPYNLWSKRIAGVGPLNMGLCRGFSFLLGATTGLAGNWRLESSSSASAPGTLIIIAFVGLTLYIAFVTTLARVETQANPPAGIRSLPFVALVLAIVSFFGFAVEWAHPFAPFNVALYAVSAYTLYAGYKIHRKLLRAPAPPIPPMIGQLIRLLLPLQATWCIASRSRAGAIAAAMLLVLWPVSRAVSRRFYAS